MKYLIKAKNLICEFEINKNNKVVEIDYCLYDFHNKSVLDLFDYLDANHPNYKIEQIRLDIKSDN